MAKRTAASPSTPRKRATSAKPNGSAATAPPEPTADDIRTRAYHRYLERGAGHGGDFDDWVAAEKELKSSRS